MLNVQQFIGWFDFNKEKSVLYKTISLVMKKIVVKFYQPFNYTSLIIQKSAISERFVTVSFDCDLIEDIKSYKWLVAMLKEYNLKASFACIGSYVEKFPDEHYLLVEMGHEIVNHTYSHPHHEFLNPSKRFNKLSNDELRTEIEKAHIVIEKTLGVSPIGFRSPHFGGLHTSRVYPILEELGYKYSSSTIASRTPYLGKPFYVNKILEIPLTPSPKYPFTCLETWGLYRAPVKYYMSDEEFMNLFKQLLTWADKFSAPLNFYFDPIDFKNSPKLAHHIFGLIASLKEERDVMIGTYKEVVEWIEKK